MRKPNTVAQLYGLPHGILHVFNTILYENEFLNPQIFQQTISLFPEQSTLLWHLKVTLIILIIFSRLCARFLGFSTFNKRPFLGFSKY
jgi:hypothetical protein